MLLALYPAVALSAGLGLGGSFGEAVCGVAAHAADTPMRPASVSKLYTATAILRRVPKKATLRTAVYRSANGLVLVGAGDPQLQPEDVRKLARQTWKHLSPAERAAPLQVSVDNRIYKVRRPKGWTKGYTLDVVQNPSPGMVRGVQAPMGKLYTASLRKLGARIDSPVLSVDPLYSHVPYGPIASHDSAPVAKILNHVLLMSDNTEAEALWRVAAAQDGAITYAQAVDWLQRYSRTGPGVHLHDGSGLSRRTRSTATDIVRLLDENRKRLTGMLPVAGRSGTLGPGYGRFDLPRSRIGWGRVEAKTGALFDTISLAGYFHRSGRPCAFAAIIEDPVDHRGKKSIRQLLDLQLADVFRNIEAAG